MIQTLQSLRDEKFLQNKANLTSISLSPQQEVLKSLAVLLTENKRETYEAVVTVLSAAAAENKHFREKVSVRENLLDKSRITRFYMCLNIMLNDSLNLVY